MFFHQLLQLLLKKFQVRLLWTMLHHIPRPFGLGIFLWLAVAERLPVNSGILGCIFLTGVVYLDLTQKSNKFQKEWNHVKG